MTQDIQISTVMLCYNRVELSKKCLEAYLDTISVPYELIILNNASTDDTKEWLEGIKGDRRITEIIHFERNDPAYALNYGLERCAGKYLHVLENDYFLFQGWDKYVIERFEKVPQLGQLGISTGSKRARGEYYQNLVVLSRINVISSSFFPRKLFVEDKIRWKSHHKGCYPHDADFSGQIKKLGLLVAMPDRPIAKSVGFSEDEYASNPDYYIRDYKLKLSSHLGFRNLARSILRLKFHAIKTDVGMLINLYSIKMKQKVTRK